MRRNPSYFGCRKLNNLFVDRQIERLNSWWGSMTLAEVNGQSCRSFTKYRKSDGGARLDLQGPRAAINYHLKEVYHRGGVFLSVVNLQIAINRFVADTNNNPKPFTWTADPDKNHCCCQARAPSVRFDPLGVAGSL